MTPPPRTIRPVPEVVIRLVQSRRVLLTKKTRLLVESLFLDVVEILHAIVEGRLVKKERDETGQARYKYIIHCPSRSGKTVYSTGKIIPGEDGRMYLVITAHWTTRR